MTLSDFLRHATVEIVNESVRFARTLEVMSSEKIDVAVLTNHLPLVLSAIALDLERPQSRQASITKSEGLAPEHPGQTAAETHGRFRAELGLTVSQVIAEYRVLRAVVVRLWAEAGGLREPRALVELIRFNEAIDQAITESVALHSAEVNRWRNTLLATIGHDLRSPLGTVVLANELLSNALKGSPLLSAVDLIRRGAHRLSELLDSLLDYNNAELGMGMKISRAQIDLGEASCSEVELLRSAHPGVNIQCTTTGPLVGFFDENRIREALTNLVSNAVQYRHPGTSIEVEVVGYDDHVALKVTNQGDPIPQELLQTFFAPLRRNDSGKQHAARRNLGIGLFIVREIACAHGGDVSADSADGAITFVMRLPKQATAKKPCAPATMDVHANHA